MKKASSPQLQPAKDWPSSFRRRRISGIPMLIKPSDKTLQELLEGGFYKIPRFQRAYSWDQENVDDFWSDAIANSDPDYFIGSFVLYREGAKSDVSLVVDGQQRLTTATILLAAIRNAFDLLPDQPLANGTQLLIERSDVNNDKRFVLITETSYPYFHEYIQKHGPPKLPPSAGREEEAIETAFKYLSKQVDAVLAAVDSDPAVAAERKSDEKRARLLKLRANVLRLQLISIELQSEDEAYVIFETLNTRGKDLGIADLVKNLLTRLLKPTNKAVDVARDKWLAILERFDASAAEIDINAFIYHSWISRNNYTGRDKLFRAIRGSLNKTISPETYLDDLGSDSELYRQILEPGSGKWSKQEAQIQASLRALALFRVAQPLPMILALLRAYRSSQITQTMTQEALRTMENFHVQFTALTAQRTGGGTAKMYAAAAQELTRAATSQQRATALKAFKRKLKARVPSLAEFEAGVERLEFMSNNTKQKALVQYLLQRLDEHQHTGPPVDYSRMTIEHIAPEKPVPGVPQEKSVGKLGNLILLDQRENAKVANKSFGAKKKAYSKASLDPTLRDATAWNSIKIDERTKALAKLAYDKVFRV